MLANILYGLAILVVVGWALQKALPWIRAKWPGKTTDTIAEVVDAVTDATDFAIGSQACFTLATLARKRGNAELAVVATNAWALVMLWPRDGDEVKPAAVVPEKPADA
jgi:hypothetical protein